MERKQIVYLVEFKVIIMRYLTKVQKGIDEHHGNFNKEL